jgi:hypothetical protein
MRAGGLTIRAVGVCQRASGLSAFRAAARAGLKAMTANLAQAALAVCFPDGGCARALSLSSASN